MHLSGALNGNEMREAKTMQESLQVGWELVSKRDALLSYL